MHVFVNVILGLNDAQKCLHDELQTGRPDINGSAVNNRE